MQRAENDAHRQREEVIKGQNRRTEDEMLALTGDAEDKILHFQRSLFVLFSAPRKSRLLVPKATA